MRLSLLYWWRLTSLAIVAALSCGRTSPAASPPDLSVIQQSLESLRLGAKVTHIKFNVKVRIVKGSLNEVLEPPRPMGTGPPVPIEDIVAESPWECVHDFRRSRSWSKGSDFSVELAKDAAGNDTTIGYFQFAESVSDGPESISLSPRHRVDPKSLSPGIKFPVEVKRFTIKEGGQQPETDAGWYPLYLSEGCLPSPDEPLGGTRTLPPFVPDKWRVSGSVTRDGQSLPVLVSAVGASKCYEEYTLRPDLGYVACRWVRYYKGLPHRVVNISYENSSAQRPRLRAWSVQKYTGAGTLFREDTYEVQYVKHLESADDSRFRIAPEDGMIVWDLNSFDYHLAGNKSVKFDTLEEANEYILQRERGWSWGLIAVVFAGIVVAGSLIWWWRRARTWS